MSYLGNEPQFTQYPSKFFNGDGTAQTVSLDYAPPNAAAVLVFIDGVRQDTSAYTLAGTNLTFTGSVPSGTNNVQVVHMGMILDVGVPGDDTVTTVKIQDNAVTLAKLEDGTQGDILYYGASGAPTRLGFGTSGHFLKTQGTGANPTWAAAGGLASVQTFTSSGTWTKPTDITSARVEIRGGGGGGGGIGTTSGVMASGGGGQGGYAIEFIDVSGTSSETVTVGAGGAGGVGASNGSVGGTSSFGSFCSATGGGVGTTPGASADASASGGSGGTGSGGDFNGTGAPGGSAILATYSRGGTGGGAGGAPPANSYSSAGVAGTAGTGGGGSGSQDNGTTARDGGAGGSGYVIVWEYK